MKTIKGPALLIAQFAENHPPFNNLPDIARWAKELGFKALQLPSWDARFIDLSKAATSDNYCSEIKSTLGEHGLELTDLVSHIQGQLCAVHPAYDAWFDGLCPPEVRGNPSKRQQWAVQQIKDCITACRRLGVTTMPTFSGSLLWPFCYPFPPRPNGLVEEGFAELAKIWKPILDHADDEGVNVCFELHPMEDLFDGVTFERFLAEVDNHPRCHINYDPSHFIKQGLDYLAFIDNYHERIKAMHVKDAEFNPSGRQGFYSGYLPWLERAARDRSLGDGQVDFKSLFSKFTQYDFSGWAVYEWECCMKHPEDGAREGAEFIQRHLIRVTDKAADDFAGSQTDSNTNRAMLGLS
ncbi:sugar phosphate isomerase/epimerase [Caballeronia novacaledonica]|uniref:sugar phosphate isomerase/epimerase family protein n=1 Tax=Caballeronia novacaledonica TaxID=1544861 RepID=UPI0003FE146C|nr:sugar phosphate isomerase/epimerase family protein [Caballeronia novacaledonica]GJH14540.1 sugar phosphate isomerase/epimerase [Caballeronia novacaledonica]